MATRTNDAFGGLPSCSLTVFSFPEPDPFANLPDDEGSAAPKKEATKSADGVQSQYIHIRVQQRNGRKSLTTLQVSLGTLFVHPRGFLSVR